MTLTNEQDPKKELKSAKQEAYCQARGLKGLNQSDSHRSAYNTNNMSDKQRWEESSKLEKTPKVYQRIDYLRNSLTEDIKDELVYTAKQSFDNLIDIQNRAKEKEVFKDELKAEELKGKIAGLYEEIHKFKGDKDAPLKTEIIVKFVTKKET